jgi:hypothetical protein
MTTLRSALLGALILSPAGALAQGLVELVPEGQQSTVVIEEPAVVVEEPVVIEEPVVVQEPRVVRERPRVIQQAVVVQEPVVQETVVIQDDGEIYEEDARAIAMMNGMVDIDEVNTTWRGNFEVEGTDASGDNIEVTIDAETGAVLDIDD